MTLSSGSGHVVITSKQWRDWGGGEGGGYKVVPRLLLIYKPSN